MKKVFCDCCGNHVTVYSEAIISLGGNGGPYPYIHKDLCRECLKKFVKLLNEFIRNFGNEAFSASGCDI